MKKIFLVFSVFLILPLFFATAVLAANDDDKKVVVLPKDQVVNDNYFAFGDSVTILGTVNGDVYAAGGDVTIDGVINGDVLAAGGKVLIRGTVSQDVRIAGGEVEVSGIVNGSVTSASGSFTATAASNIGQSVVAGSGETRLLGPVGRGVFVGGSAVTIANVIRGNVKVSAKSVSLASGASIGGDLDYWSPSAIDRDPGARVLGNMRHNVGKQDKDSQGRKAFAGVLGAGFLFKLISFVSAFILGILLLKVIPNASKQISGVILKKPFRAFFVGFVTMVLVPIAFVVLLATIIGIPIAFILLFAFLLSLYFGKIIFALAVGEYIVKTLKLSSGAIASLFLGLAVYAIFSSIPVFGIFISFFAVVSGFGAIVIFKKTFYHALREKKLL